MSVFSWQNCFSLSVVPLLPSTLMSWLGMRASWAIVLANIALQFSHSRTIGVRRWIVLLAVIYAIVPGPVSITYWLGLAFQSPSIASVLLSLVFLSKDLLLTKDGGRDEGSKLKVWINIQAAILIVIGYLLLLDTFAILPFQMYRFGFGQVPLLAIALISYFNLFICRKKYSSSKANGVLIVVGVFIFAGTRLPTGNVWDAILDPWLWLFLQVFIFRNLADLFVEKLLQPSPKLGSAQLPVSKDLPSDIDRVKLNTVLR
jgi:hypothetical protein